MIALTGDLHGQVERINNSLLLKNTLTSNDTLIILGDFGAIWNNEKSSLAKLESLAKNNFTIAFLDGNHEDYNLLSQMEMEEKIIWNGGRAGLLPYNIIHLLRGEVYTIEGKTIGVCGGADSIDKHLRTKDKDWWAAERILSKDINTLISNIKSKTNSHLDAMLSHECPTEALQLLAVYYPSILDWLKDENPSRRQLDRLFQEDISIDKWYFGHHHLDLPITSKYRALYTDFISL